MALDPENTLHMQLKDGLVVIELVARNSARSCGADQDPGARRVLRRHRVSSRH